jgi:para-nitrobenzyl esterase
MRYLRRRRSECLLRAAILTAAAAVIAALSVTAGSPRAAAAAPGAPPCTAGTLVQTKDGPVCGLVGNGVTSYLGIPYAAPPVGALRWQPPAPVSPSTTTLTATQAPARCPQPTFPGSPAPVTSEDCLRLNVQVPTDAGGSPLPVMVEVHGGGFLLGGPPDTAHLAAAGHVIVVAIQYRLGILGFLAHKDLGANSGDYGLQDQQAALRWLQRNIGAFGGDPHNVTLFGQSAGGASVCAAAVSPTAAGLFQKGISESAFFNYNVNTIWATGDCKSQLPTEAQAQQAGASFATKVGCGSAADVAACLRAVPVPALVSNGGQILDPAAGGTIGPTINGTTLPMSPATAFATGHLNNIRLIVGTARDEFNGGLYDPSTIASTPEQYQALVRQQYGALAQEVMTRYPLSRFPDSSPFIAHRTIMADAVNVCPALIAERQIAKHIPVYAFENDNADTPQLNGTLPLGAFHNAENPFLFPNPALTLDPNQAVFGDQVIAEWAGFARTGDPTVPGTPLWTRYTTSDSRVMSLVPAGDSALTPTSTIRMQHQCDFWDGVNAKAPWAIQAAQSAVSR